MNICNALILAGGYSTRMGMDKCMIDYHRMPQHEHVARLMVPLVQEVFLSCRKDQAIETSLPVLIDTIPDIGPMAGVAAAFEKYPAAAWLVIACDMPLVDEAVLAELISQRDPSKQASYFINPESGMPEPLLSIYEPNILPVLRAHIERKQFSLNRLLQQCDGKSIMPSDPGKLVSVNTTEEYLEAKAMISRSDAT